MSRLPTIAAVLSAIVPGLGQLAAGKPGEAAGWFYGEVTVIIAVSAFAGGNNTSLPFFALIPIDLACRWFSAKSARRAAALKLEADAAQDARLSALPPPPPVSPAQRVLAGILVAWLGVSALASAALAAVLVVMVPLSLASAALAYFLAGASRGALHLARGGLGRRPRITNVRLSVMTAAACLGWAALTIITSEFSGLLRHADEGSAKGNLGAIRSALSIYYGDLEGQYPSDLTTLTVGGRYLTRFPEARLTGLHRASAAVRYGKEADDSGGWLYNNRGGDANIGALMVNCTHTDTKGTVWTTY